MCWQIKTVSPKKAKLFLSVITNPTSYLSSFLETIYLNKRFTSLLDKKG